MYKIEHQDEQKLVDTLFVHGGAKMVHYSTFNRLQDDARPTHVSVNAVKPDPQNASISTHSICCFGPGTRTYLSQWLFLLGIAAIGQHPFGSSLLSSPSSTLPTLPPSSPTVIEGSTKPWLRILGPDRPAQRCAVCPLPKSKSKHTLNASFE